MRLNQDVMPMILLNKGTSSMIANCEMKGNSAFPTCGIVIKKATCIIKETVIDGFIKGGVLMWLQESNICKIFTTNIRNCKNYGIQCIGDVLSLKKLFKKNH